MACCLVSKPAKQQSDAVKETSIEEVTKRLTRSICGVCVCMGREEGVKISNLYEGSCQGRCKGSDL